MASLINQYQSIIAQFNLFSRAGLVISKAHYLSYLAHKFMVRMLQSGEIKHCVTIHGQKENQGHR